MIVVGLRELKNRLSEYVRQVKAGESILVTDRGTVVAELRPPGRTSGLDVSTGLRDLAEKGLITIGAPNHPDAYPRLPPLLSRDRVKELLDEERGER